MMGLRRGTLRGMRDSSHPFARVLFGSLAAAALAGSAAGCSDDKPEHAAPGASAGNERPQGKNAIDEAHSDFKDAVQPAAGWVDEKSHRAADELNTAAGKVKGAFEEDEPAPVAKEKIKAAPEPTTTTAPATTTATTKE
jgi:hypothetical protein